MKIQREGKPAFVIGKRVTLGAAILGVANGLAAIFPEHSQAILGFVTPVVFIAQIYVVNKYGVTQS